MVDWWLDQPVWLLFLVLIVLFGAITGVIHTVSYGRGGRSRFHTLGGVAPPLFGAVAVLFGILLGFVANDALERNRAASRAVLGERDSILALHQLSIATISDMSEIRRSLSAYVESVVRDEWPRMADGEASVKSAAAINQLLHDIADPRLSAEAGQVSHHALMELALKIRASRSDRLALAEQESDVLKWWAVFGLAVITLVALALVHLERPRAQLAALVVFSVAAVMALGLVAIRDRPFDGPLKLTPAVMQAALDSMTDPPTPSPPAGPKPKT